MAGIFLPGASKGGDITAVTAGDGLSGGGDSGDLTVTLDLNELTAAAVADGDFIPIIDTNDSNGSRKEAVHDLATLFSGTGLTATNSVIAVDASQGQITTVGTIATGTWEGTTVAVDQGGTGATSLSNLITLTTHTSGNYVATITGGTGITSSAATSGEGTTHSLSIDASQGQITTVGALDAGSITSGFTSIDVGSGGITTTGAIAGGTIDASTDFTIGTLVITDNTVVMTPSTSDTVTVAAATNGVLNITTVDNAAAAANLNFIVDGAVDVDSAGAINLDSGSGIWTFEDSGTEMLRFTEGNSGDVTIKLETNAKDLIFTDNGDATGLTIKDAAAGIVVPGEVMTTKISFTDGDDAITIADSGLTTIAKTMTFSTDANVVLGDGGNVNISTPLLANADHTTTGITAEMLAGAAIAAFNVVCIHTTTQEVIVADASAYATARAIGIAPAAISDTATGTVLLQGFIRDDTWNWTTGATLYLSETAGAMTETAPTTDGAFDVVVGVALEPDVVYFNPSMDVIEHA